DAGVLVAERESAEFFEAVVRRADGTARDAKIAANWVINELFGRLNREGGEIGTCPITANALGTILDLMSEGAISGKIAKDLFEIVWTEGGDPRAIVESLGMRQVTDTAAIEKLVAEIVANNPDKVEQARRKPALVGWFVGQAMKASGGKANPQAVNDLVKTKLGL
ncbi:MAG: Asp-tRNA(Asn)/Glu-tRNA(Gln) amidotransferase GatCAB subunit B, partial [Xanthobacteraceae bacterium]|nr:Asp-tRNA(Asn)/Glu-tRNA(Gln) amidotransferase GatCAB subunit B [Xanthobacteraceae bacterium]